MLQPVLRRSAELIAYEIKRGAAGSVLGTAWAVVQPLLFVGSYWFLLGVLDARRPGSGGTGREIATLLAGVVPWLFFARALSAGLRALPARANLVKQIAFPTAVLPFAAVGAHAADLATGAVVLLAATVAAGSVTWSLCLLLPALALLACAMVAAASLLSPLAVMLPDVRRLVQVTLRAGLFVTPVLYLPSALPAGADVLAYLNPMAYFIAVTRFAVTGSREAAVIDPAADLLVAGAFTLVLGGLAWALHRRTWATAVDHV